MTSGRASVATFSIVVTFHPLIPVYRRLLATLSTRISRAACRCAASVSTRVSSSCLVTNANSCARASRYG